MKVENKSNNFIEIYYGRVVIAKRKKKNPKQIKGQHWHRNDPKPISPKTEQVVSCSSGSQKDSWKDEVKQLEGLDVFVLCLPWLSLTLEGFQWAPTKAKEEFPLPADVSSALQGSLVCLSLEPSNKRGKIGR